MKDSNANPPILPIFCFRSPQVRQHHVTHGFTTPAKVEPSGVPMPAGLAPYITDTLVKQCRRRKSKRRDSREPAVFEDNSTAKPEQASGSRTELMWTEPETVTKEDVASLSLTEEHEPEHQLVICDQQDNLDHLDVVDALPQAFESDDLAAEAAYAVQVLESDENAGSTTSLPSQLDLGFVEDSNSVCVVYLID